MPTQYNTTPLFPPMVVTGFTALKHLVNVSPPPLHYFAAIMGGEWFIFDNVTFDDNGIRIKGDFDLADYLNLVIANKPLLSVLTVRPAHARYAFYYSDFGKDNPDKAITRSEAKGLRYMEAIMIATEYIELFRKLNTSNERHMEIGNWELEYYTPNGKLLTRKFWITEEYILDEANLEETNW